VFGASFVFVAVLALLMTMSSTTMQDVGSVAVVVSHLMVVPAFVLAYDTTWLVLVLASSTIFSLLYHLSDTEIVLSYANREMFEHADTTIQSVLVVVLAFLYMFDQFPTNGMVLLIPYAVFIGIFGEVAVGSYTIYEVCDLIAFGSTFVFLFVKVVRDRSFFTTKRKWQYTVAFVAYQVIGSICFLVAADAERHQYVVVHSMWHTVAYSGIYFVIRSRTSMQEPSEVRIERTSFAVKYNKI
jgi:hypothetical protein